MFAWIAGWKSVAFPGDYGNVNTYFWIPIVGPMVGAALGALVYDFGIRNTLIARGAKPDPEMVEKGATHSMNRRGPDNGEIHRRDRPGHDELRFILFDHDGRIVHVDQREHEQITPQAGWVEHDAKEIWTRTREVIGGALASGPAEAGELAAVGITNQRETRRVGPRDRRADPQRDRLAGHANRSARARARRRGGRRPAARTRSGCRSRPTSRGRRSAGCSTTSTARGSGPRPASWRSAPWTPGCCGT